MVKISLNSILHWLIMTLSSETPRDKLKATCFTWKEKRKKTEHGILGGFRRNFHLIVRCTTQNCSVLQNKTSCFFLSFKIWHVIFLQINSSVHLVSLVRIEHKLAQPQFDNCRTENEYNHSKYKPNWKKN